MKRFLVSGAILLVVFSSFTSFSKLSFITIYYHPSSDKTLIQPGQTNSLVTSEMLNSGNWNSTAIPFSSSGTKLAALTFNQDNVVDGVGDGAVTIVEAINLVTEYYVDHDDLPADGSSIRFQEDASRFTDITVRRKD